MAATALRALCGAAELAPAFWGGDNPLLPALLRALPQALEDRPLGAFFYTNWLIKEATPT